MTDPRGFLQIQRRLAPYRPVDERIARLRRAARARRPRASCASRRSAAWTAACRSATTGCPLGEPDPRLERPRAPRRLARRPSERLHAHEQLPRVHGQALPRALRGGVRPHDQRRRRHDQGDRAARSPSARSTRAGSCPSLPACRPGRSVGIVGSGPAGLACAAAARARRPRGHGVRARRPPRRPAALRHPRLQARQGVRRPCGSSSSRPRASSSRCGVECGVDLAADELRARHDAIVLATGAQRHRDLELPGRELDGVHLAMPYLIAQNRRVAGLPVDPAAPTRERASASRSSAAATPAPTASATCSARARPRWSRSRTAPRRRASATPLRTWPEWPTLLRSYAAHEEGGERHWQVADARARGRGRAVATPAGAPRRVSRTGPRRARAASVPVEDVAARRRPRAARDRLRRASSRSDGLAASLGVGVSAARHDRDRRRASRPASRASSPAATACAAPT